MLACLRHDALVGGNDQQDEVDAGGAGEHVLNEPLVPRNIDDAHSPSTREVEVGKAEVDRHAPALLFFQPIRVDPGEGFDEGALAVVDVPGGADDEVTHTLIIVNGEW